MIVKKPYAFLIKYFKAIHFVLSILLALIIIKHFSVMGFFQTYVNNDYIISISYNLGGKYLPLYLFGSIILVLLIISVIIFLLNHKNKPIKFYFIMLGYYIFLFFLFIYLHSVLNSFKTNLLESTEALLFRDIVVLTILPQLYFFAICAIRAFGFNLKKFDFAADLRDLNMVNSDNEEVEINISFDNETAQRKIRKTFREITYYFFENKLIISIIFVCVVIFGIYSIITNKSSNYDNVYQTGSTFYYNGMQVTVTDSIITNLNYDSSTLDKYYLVAKVEIKNVSDSLKSLDLNQFKLMAGSKIYTTTSKAYKYFIDMSSESFKTSINRKGDIKTILVFPIEKNSLRKKYKIRIYNGSVRSNDSIYEKNIYVKLNPTVMNKINETTKYSLGVQSKFSDSFLYNTSLTVNSCMFTTKYKYSYSVCKNGSCSAYDNLLTPSSTSKQILLCNIEYKQDSSSWYSVNYKNITSFIDNFVKIKDVDSNKILTKAKNVTPSDAADFIAFEVPDTYTDLSDLQIDIKIRNNEYLLFLIG